MAAATRRSGNIIVSLLLRVYTPGKCCGQAVESPNRLLGAVRFLYVLQISGWESEGTNIINSRLLGVYLFESATIA